ncbi:MAG: hypothetical protein WBO66_00530 [Candidatus Moraniibacteriota bacterium]
MVNKENINKNQRDQAEPEEELIAGMTAAERHQLMLDVRLTPEQRKIADRMAQESVDNLNRNVLEEEGRLP